ncbi:hypothetical protein [Nostoc commune]|uniref:hypothetical protein n=1 Tax=Nostoc commune TaxID=1178 RepID=UPI001E5246C9|nr:hypothetical protein [Nostoc commune]
MHKSKIRTSPRQSYALSPLPKPLGRGWGWGIRDFCKRSPLLNLAGFYDEPFYLRGEESIEISAEDEGEIIRGRIDVLVIQEQFWLLVIESKRSSFSLLEAVPQALVYMLANPNQDKPTFGLVTNGSDFIFIKLTKQNIPKYALSDEFTMLKRKSELYQVLSVLKNLSQILS